MFVSDCTLFLEADKLPVMYTLYHVGAHARVYAWGGGVISGFFIVILTVKS